jgi:C-terminal processing protease CtpA/Prc
VLCESVCCVADTGIVVEQGAYISRIIPGSAASKDNMISVGDRIINVSGLSPVLSTDVL